MNAHILAGKGIRLLTLVTTLLAIVFVSMPTNSWAERYVDKYNYKGLNADASWYDSECTQINGCEQCTETYANVWAYEEVTRTAPGRPSPQAEACVYLDKYTVSYCTWEWEPVISVYGCTGLEKGDFEIANNLKSAVLGTIIPVYDWWNGSEYNVIVDLSWSSIGTLEKYHGNSHYRSVYYKYNDRYMGKYSPAEASGRLIDEITGINFAQDVSDWASLGSSKGGSVVIERYK